ncbi:MAG: glycosyltransferase family 2 protein [Blastocatellales bacterium]
MDTPVALIIFNRPDCTRLVLDRVAKSKPKKLLVIADGPRPNRPDDVEKCAATRAVIERVDWDCDVVTDYSDVNLGCKMRPVTGVNWLFEQVEEAIILEDDCLPDPSFFPFCEELLKRYRDDERVMMIGGFNFFGQHHHPSPRQSYYFSYLGSTWGWATWRRAWRLNDPEMEKWPLVVESKLIDHLFPDPVHARYWYDVFARILDGRMHDTWDYQWQLSCWFNSGFRIFPETSLISNIGFREDATHTFGANPFGNDAMKINFPLKHPELMARCFEADNQIVETFRRLDGFEVPPPPRRNIVRRVAGRLAREFGL